METPLKVLKEYMRVSHYMKNIIKEIEIVFQKY